MVERDDLTGGWEIEVWEGSASDLHARSAATIASGGPVKSLQRTLRLMRSVGPAVVLGTAQPDSDVDKQQAAARGYEVTRRRSGGGAVLVGPAECVWIDLVVPADDPLWDHDVARGAWWVGEVIGRALESLALGPAVVWRDPMIKGRWASRVCFSGLAGGEVLIQDRKVVGVSQRRTRRGALLQTATLIRWRPADLLGVLSLAEEEAAIAIHELANVASGIGIGSADLVWEAVVDQLMP